MLFREGLCRGAAGVWSSSSISGSELSIAPTVFASIVTFAFPLFLFTFDFILCGGEGVSGTSVKDGEEVMAVIGGTKVGS